MANAQCQRVWEQFPVSYDALNLNEDYYSSVIAPDTFELFDIELPSIHSDVLKISSDIGSDDCGGAVANGSSVSDSFSVTDFFDIKPEIRNGDCMWSGNAYSSQQQNANGSGDSSSAASSYSESMANAVPLAAVTGSTPAVGTTTTAAFTEKNTTIAATATATTTTTTQKLQTTIQQRQPALVVANKSKFLQQQKQQQQQQQKYPTMLNLKAEIKVELHSDYELQLQQHNIPNNNRTNGNSSSSSSSSSSSNRASGIAANNTQQSMQHIPPGTSLLRKSNNNHVQQAQKKYQHKFQMQLLQKEQQQRNVMHLENSSCMLTPNTPSTSWSAAVNGNVSATTSTNDSPVFLRPDTPHSLDDDDAAGSVADVGAEFRHNVDLRACVMGSNNLALPSESLLIDRLSRELQNTSKTQLDNIFGNTMPTLNEVMDIIGNQPTASMSSASSTTSSTSASSSSASASLAFSSTSSCSALSLSGNGDLDDHANGDSGGGGGGGLGCVDNLKSECESSDDGECSLEGSSCEFATSLLLGDVDGSSGHYLRHISDHSYTRCKDMGMDDLSTNLETPSDSDEEIDVVSVGDKKLPTNPSDKDRRVLQSKVAHKFSNARIVKTAYGVRTIPPRRRGSYELPYTPASSSPVKSVANSRYPSPASTPYQQYAVSPASQCAGDMLTLTNGATTSTPLSANMLNKSRKRFLLTTANGCRGDLSGLIGMPPMKKYRVKKSKHAINNGIMGITTATATATTTATAAAASAVTMLGTTNTMSATTSTLNMSPNGNISSSSSSSSSSSNSSSSTISSSSSSSNSNNNTMLKRQFSLDEADTIEKRNLHNDMERQRRIGLKNLFEALKKQIPSIKDKERAPKVNILREAAKLCEQLTRDDRELNEQRAQLMEQLRIRKELLTRLRASSHKQALTVKSELE